MNRRIQVSAASLQIRPISCHLGHHCRQIAGRVTMRVISGFAGKESHHRTMFLPHDNSPPALGIYVRQTIIHRNDHRFQYLRQYSHFPLWKRIWLRPSAVDVPMTSRRRGKENHRRFNTSLSLGKTAAQAHWSCQRHTPVLKEVFSGESWAERIPSNDV